MAITEKAVEAVRFICNHLGEPVYIVDSVCCDECPDFGGLSCVHSRQGRHSLKAIGNCRSRRVMVYTVSMDRVDVILQSGDDHVVMVIDDCYFCKPGEIFTTREAATKHMESLPDDVLKYYPSA